MFSQRKGRDVYVLGSANVGKSTFIRAALKAMREQGNFFVPGKRLPTASAMPGTTLAGRRPFTPKNTLLKPRIVVWFFTTPFTTSVKAARVHHLSQVL